MDNQPILNFHCLCGAIAVTLENRHNRRIGACRCRMSNQWSGGVFLSIDAQADAVTVTGEVARHPSSSFSERASCLRCGSSLWIRDTDRDDARYELMPGLFDEARDRPLRSEIYIDRALASARLVGDHPRNTRADYEAGHLFVEGDNP